MSSNNQNFRLSLNTYETNDNSYVINLCLKCINPVCQPIINALQQKYSGEDYGEDDMLCLLQSNLETYEKPIYDKTFQSYYKAELRYFYNHVKLGELSEKLKGAEIALLCILLAETIKNGTKGDDVIITYVPEELDKEDKEDLVNLFEELGFQQVKPLMYNYAISNGFSIPMYGKIGEIYENCSKGEFSDELINILQTLS